MDETGQIIRVNSDLAFLAIKHQLLPRRYILAFLVWETVATVCVLGAFPALFFLDWWVCFGVFVFGAITHQANKQSLQGFIIEEAMLQGYFYDVALTAGIISISPPEDR